MACDRQEQPVAGAVERFEQLEEDRLETFRAAGPDVGRHLVGKAMPRRELPADMPEFLQVDHGGVLRDLGLERRIAPRTAAAGNVVAALLLFRQVEQLPGFGPGAIDQIARNAVIGDDRETETLERSAQRGGKGIRIGCLVIE